MYINFVKRIIDFLVAFILLCILCPILIFIVIILIVVNKGKPFFMQERPGKNEKRFKIIKFKTMTDECDEDGKLLPDSERLTRIGRFIRKNSLDEFLQLLNVLKGDMSVVGPRPLSVKYLPLYDELQKKRHSVLPGITGMAQINGRNAITWKKKFEYDNYYVDNISFILDIKIILKTVYKVLSRDNVREGGHGEIESFNGSN